MDLLTKKYQIIYADPPWKFGSKAYQDNNRKMLKLEETQYDTMETKDIMLLPIKNITAENSALFLWVTDAHLKEGIQVIESWGFKYKTVAFVWLKKYQSGSTVYNYAPWTLKSHELCLLGLKGSMGKYKICNNVKGFSEEIRTIHSKKPDIFRTKIDTLFGNLTKIELFARNFTSGWDAWGNQVPTHCQKLLLQADA